MYSVIWTLWFLTHIIKSCCLFRLLKFKLTWIINMQARKSLLHFTCLCNCSAFEWWLTIYSGTAIMNSSARSSMKRLLQNWSTMSLHICSIQTFTLADSAFWSQGCTLSTWSKIRRRVGPPCPSLGTNSSPGLHWFSSWCLTQVKAV